MTHSIVRATIHYSGHVQGVGFRYTVFQIAKAYEVSGFIQNLADSRVLLVAEGKAEEIEHFVGEIAERMATFVRSTERVDESGSHQHRGFSIR
jgi:acylphosphatase